MYGDEFECPVCGASMVKKKGHQKTFFGCMEFPRTRCVGKRDLNGNSWGCDTEEPYYLDEEGSSMFQACLNDGFSYVEASEIAIEWQRQEEKDRWK